MPENEPRVREMTEERFRYIFKLFKIAGLPIDIEEVTKLRSMYNLGMLLCTYSVYISTVLELILGKNDVKYFMKAFREFVGMVMYMWIEHNIRYV
ncbi:hypothetical protein ANN_17342 [Periplaneta americana]|uniref:Uncharacterized protein n=1 Tax=Periplaneta americana TaxID=6978 RepID=A0ABQ8SU34_PERAM|nr:hypothetical protein ANN_17342 [Periplaneta americana]